MNQQREVIGHDLFATLKGKTLAAVKRVDTGAEGGIGTDGGDELWLACTDGTRYRMWHEQDCCEHVEITDIAGDIDLLIGMPLTVAEVVESSEERLDDSNTWTFYKLGAIKDSVTIRWHGSSNGYYSESVSFRRLTDWSGDPCKALESAQLIH